MSIRTPVLASRLELYLVADPAQTRHDLLIAVDQALANGVTAVQLRAKSLTDRDHFALALAIAERCRRANALFLVNDRVDIALASHADGVHLGASDLPVAVARRLLRNTAIIGYSPETDDEAAQAAGDGASYLGVGPVFSTGSKGDAGEPLGFESLRRRIDLAGIPVVAIGGIKAENVLPIRASGAVGVAVLSAILGAEDPGEATLMLRDASRATGT